MAGRGERRMAEELDGTCPSRARDVLAVAQSAARFRSARTDSMVVLPT
jgi:hypothetical protein